MKEFRGSHLGFDDSSRNFKWPWCLKVLEFVFEIPASIFVDAESTWHEWITSHKKGKHRSISPSFRHMWCLALTKFLMTHLQASPLAIHSLDTLDQQSTWSGDILGIVLQRAMDILCPFALMNWLVVWNMTFLTFHSVGNVVIIPAEELIFFNMVISPPTSEIWCEEDADWISSKWPFLAMCRAKYFSWHGDVALY